MRLDFWLSQDFADRSLGQLAKAGMPCQRCVLTGMRGEQPSGPQLVRISQLFGLLARQRHQPGLCFGRNDRVASGARPIIERLDHPQFRRSFEAAGHGLLRHPNPPRHHVRRRLLQISQDNPRSFDTARRLGSRPRNLQQMLPLLFIARQRDDATRCHHWIPQSNPHPLLTTSRARPRNPTQYIDISESLHYLACADGKYVQVALVCYPRRSCGV